MPDGEVSFGGYPQALLLKEESPTLRYLVVIWISPGLPADAERDLGSLYIFLAPLFLGLGAVAGPATIGLVADRRGLGAALLLAAAVAIATVLARPGGAAGQPGGQRGGQPAGAG